jgi:hypothetical protein
MSFIKSRLRWAEASVRGTSCTECGLPPNGPVRIVYVPGIPEGTEEFCSCCGRRLWFVIEVVGADQGAGHRLWHVVAVSEAMGGAAAHRLSAAASTV